jgi:hypothetical protein
MVEGSENNPGLLCHCATVPLCQGFLVRENRMAQWHNNCSGPQKLDTPVRGRV